MRYAYGDRQSSSGRLLRDAGLQPETDAERVAAGYSAANTTRWPVPDGWWVSRLEFVTPTGVRLSTAPGNAVCRGITTIAAVSPVDRGGAKYCVMCHTPTESQWGTATDNPHYICDDCGNDAVEETLRGQQEWLASGRCTCCGSADLSTRAGSSMGDQLCENCIWDDSPQVTR